MNPFDQFDAPQSANPFDQFDGKAPPKMGAESFKDILRRDLKDKDWFTRNLIGAGTALTDVYQGVKQFVGAGDRSQIEANQVIQNEAPVGSLVGSGMLAATPFGIVGGGIRGAAGVGAAMGALQPVAGEQSLGNIAQGKAINTAVGGVAGAAGQKVADVVTGKIAERVARNQFDKKMNSSRDALVQEAQQAGLVIPPSAVNPSLKNLSLESVGGKIATQQAASSRNESEFNNLVRRTLGMADDAELSPEGLKAFRKEVAERTYGPVAGSGRVETDAFYQKSLDKIVEKYVTTEKDFPTGASNPVVDLVNGKGQILKKGTPDRKGFAWDDGTEISGFQPPKAPKIRNLLDEIKKAGGIAISEVGDIGEQGIQKQYPGLLNKRTGLDGDSLVEWMGQKGWLQQSDIIYADQNLPGGAQELARDMLRQSLKKEPVIHPKDGEAWYKFQQAMQDMGNIAERTIPGTPDEIANGLRVKSFDAANGVKKVQLLRDEAGEAFAKGEKELGRAKREAAKALEDQLERHLASFGAGAEAKEMLQNFREGRKLLAKSYTIEKALTPGSNAIDSRKLVADKKRGKPLEGELDLIARFAGTFPKAAQPASQVQGAGVSALNAFAGTALGGGGFALGGAPGLLASAIPFVARPAARAYSLSPRSQNALRDLYQIGIPTRSLERLLPYAALGSNVAALESLN